MKLIRHAGTLLPLLFITLFTLAFLASLDGALTWERPLTYGLTVVCLYLGIHALVSMARQSFDDCPTLFILVLIWHKIGLFLTYVAILAAALLNTSHTVDFIPEWLLWAMLVSCSGMLCISNLILFFGRKRDWLTARTKGLPFACILADYRNKRARRP